MTGLCRSLLTFIGHITLENALLFGRTDVLGGGDVKKPKFVTKISIKSVLMTFYGL
jgi:hypothetical protein